MGRLVTFTDEFGYPHTIEINESSREEYEKFGSHESEIVLEVNKAKEESIMCKVNKHLVVFEKDHAIIVSPTKGKMYVTVEAANNLLNNYTYEDACEKIDNMIERLHKRMDEIHEYDHHSKQSEEVEKKVENVNSVLKNLIEDYQMMQYLNQFKYTIDTKNRKILAIYPGENKIREAQPELVQLLLKYDKRFANDYNNVFLGN